MSTLRYSGPTSKCGNLKEGTEVTVPTDWCTDSSGRVPHKAMGEIIVALHKQGISIYDYDLSETFKDSFSFTLKGFKWMTYWKKV